MGNSTKSAKAEEAKWNIKRIYITAWISVFVLTCIRFTMLLWLVCKTINSKFKLNFKSVNKKVLNFTSGWWLNAKVHLNSIYAPFRPFCYCFDYVFQFNISCKSNFKKLFLRFPGKKKLKINFDVVKILCGKFLSSHFKALLGWFGFVFIGTWIQIYVAPERKMFICC